MNVTSFSDNIFSSAITDLQITSTDTQVSVVFVDAGSANATVFLDVALDTYNGQATLYDTRAAIEDYMKAEGLAFLSLEIQLEGVNDATEIAEVTRCVIFCESAVSVTPESVFLSSQKSKCIPRNQSDVIHFYYPGTGSIEETWKLFYIGSSGTVVTVSENRFWTAQGAGVKQLIVSSDYLTNEYQLSGTLLAASLTIGSRGMTFYFVDDIPDLVLSFRNVFNVIEKAFLHGVTKSKTSSEKSTATCGGIDSFYDVVNSIEYQFESAPLTIDVATWLQQLVLSPYILKGEEEILITEHTCEVSDADDGLNSIKFTYQHPDGRLRIDLSSSGSSSPADEEPVNDNQEEEIQGGDPVLEA